MNVENLVYEATKVKYELEHPEDVEDDELR